MSPRPNSAGAASRSFTSTAVNVVTSNARTMVRVERRPKAKAYMRLHTSLVRTPCFGVRLFGASPSHHAHACPAPCLSCCYLDLQ